MWLYCVYSPTIVRLMLWILFVPLAGDVCPPDGTKRINCTNLTSYLAVVFVVLRNTKTL